MSWSRETWAACIAEEIGSARATDPAVAERFDRIGLGGIERADAVAAVAIVVAECEPRVWSMMVADPDDDDAQSERLGVLYEVSASVAVAMCSGGLTIGAADIERRVRNAIVSAVHPDDLRPELRPGAVRAHYGGGSVVLDTETARRVAGFLCDAADALEADAERLMGMEPETDAADQRIGAEIASDLAVRITRALDDPPAAAPGRSDGTTIRRGVRVNLRST